MENGRTARGNRKFGLLLLLYLLVLYKSLIVHVLIENKYPEWISLPPRAQTTLQFDLEQDDLLAAPKLRRSFNTNIRRSQMPTVYYRNSTSTFRPIIQLIHDIEPNPGPDHLVSDFKRKSNSNLTIARSTRSLWSAGIISSSRTKQSSIISLMYSLYLNLGLIIRKMTWKLIISIFLNIHSELNYYKNF